jgi:hypothetical protein
MRRTSIILLGLAAILAVLVAAWSLASADGDPADDTDAIVIDTPGTTEPEVPLDDIRDETPISKPDDTPVSSPPGTAVPLPPDSPILRPSPDTNPAAPPAPTTPPSVADPLPPGTERVLAPIDGADILVLESFPAQYLLRVLAGLPGGCAAAAGHDLSRSGDTIRVQVYNSMPTGPVACTMIYGTYELNVPLGSDFQSGREYVIEVNDKRLTLRAQ